MTRSSCAGFSHCLRGLAALSVLALATCQVFEGLASVTERDAITAEPQELRRFSVADGEQILCVCFTADGRGVIAGTASGWIWIWDTGDAKNVRKVRAASGELIGGGVECIACTPDGKLLLAGCGNGDVCVVDVATWKAIRTLTGDGDAVTSLALLKDGHRGLAGYAGAGRGSIRLWNVDEGKELFRVKADSYPASLDVAPDQDAFLSAEFKTIYLREVATGKVIQAFKGHRFRVGGAFFLPHDHKVVSGCLDQPVRLWDVKTANAEQTFEVEGFALQQMSVFPKSHLVLLGGQKEARLWDLASGKQLKRWDGLDGHAWVAFSPDGCDALIADEWGCVRLLQVQQRGK